MQKKKKEKPITLREVVGIMLKAFQGNQDYMTEKFNAIDERFNQVDANFKQVTQKINSINLNIVDITRTEEFEKLDSRVVILEEKIADKTST